MARTFSPKVIEGLNQAAKAWERDWDKSIIQNFISGGRPKWPPVKRGGMPLQKTGRLRNAIGVKTRIDGKGKYTFIAKVQGVKYARLQQYGGIIKPTNAKALAIPLTAEAEKRSPRSWGKKLFFMEASKGKSETIGILAINKGRGKNARPVPQYALRRSVRVVGRPYLVVHKEDATLLRRRAKEAIAKGMGK